MLEHVPPTTEAKNVVGAVLFICYVLAALLFTALIVRNLLFKYSSSSINEAKGKKLYVFASLAALSFAHLSHRMLQVLVVSFHGWKTSTRAEVKVNLHPSDDFFEVALTRPSELWTWLTGSTQFMSFASNIFLTRSRSWWTTQALFFTVGCNWYTAYKGRSRRVPRLWYYAILGQILPISFALNLAFVAMILYDDTKVSAPLFPLRSAFVAVTYRVGLVYADIGLEGSRLLLFVVIIRLSILFLFYFVQDEMSFPGGAETEDSCGHAQGEVSLPGTANREELRTAVALNCMLAFFLFGVQTWQTLDTVNMVQLLAAINEHPAVSALGYDYLLGLVSITVWSWHI